MLANLMFSSLSLIGFVMKQAFIILYILCLSTAMKAQDMQYVVLFEFNKSTIPDSSMLGLMKIIAKNKISDVVIEGHCDSVGSKEYNYALSENRAAEVKKLLVQNGIDQKAIKMCIGYGKDKPLVPNLSDTQRQMNRRVTVHFKTAEPDKKVAVMKDIQKIDKKDLKVGRKIVIKNLFFYGGSHILTTESLPVLQNLADILKENPTMKIEIQGHVCCTTVELDGYDADTGLDNLSVARAEMVYIHLVHKCGIDKSRLSYKGYGGTQKITQDERTEELQQINRRVEIKILSE